MVFDWPPNWATREGRRENEAVYPLDIHELNLKSFSLVVGQVGDIIRPVQKSENAKFGTDNYNTEFSMCMSGITVLGYAFGTNAFCTEVRNCLLTLKGTYIIISNYKTAAKVPSYLPINHEFEIVFREGSVITPVTVQKNYDDFRARPTNPENQVFVRKFGQGHKRPQHKKKRQGRQKRRNPVLKINFCFWTVNRRFLKEIKATNIKYDRNTPENISRCLKKRNVEIKILYNHHNFSVNLPIVLICYYFSQA